MTTKRTNKARRFHKYKDDTPQEGSNSSTGIVTAIVGMLVVAFLFITNPHWSSFEGYNFINAGCCLWIPLFVILFVLKQDPQQFGLSVGDRKLGLKWSLGLWMAMLIPVFVASKLPAFVDQYLHGRLMQNLFGLGQVFDGVHVNLKMLLYYELSMGFYMFCWEFFFRGFLLSGLQKTKLGVWGAVVVQSLPFMLLHWSYQASASKPTMEVFGSLIAGLILGVVAVRTRSFIYGYLSHWAVSVTLDLFLLIPFIIHQYG